MAKSTRTLKTRMPSNSKAKIDEHNAKDKKYKQGINQFTDMTQEEVIKSYTGYTVPVNQSAGPWTQEYPDLRRQMLNSFKTLPAAKGK
jgi:hypothetical protein